MIRTAAGSVITERKKRRLDEGQCDIYAHISEQRDATTCNYSGVRASAGPTLRTLGTFYAEMILAISTSASDLFCKFFHLNYYQKS